MKINVNGITRDMTAEEEKAYLESQVDNRTYGEKVNDLVREKYSLSDELAILRKADTSPDEFKEYYQFVEECKIKVKENL